jgi:AcrR family transcriptional regulator
LRDRPAAFNEVVQRVRTRITSITLGTDVRRNVSAVPRELLPLDDRRAEEARIVVAFAARATTSPALADIQQTVLTAINEELTEAFTLAAAGSATAKQCTLAAHVAVAAADGLALHAVSSGGGMTTDQLTAALELLLDALMLTAADKADAGYS